MQGDACDEMRLLVQADVDGELPVADSARVGAHLERCPACANMQAGLLALSRRIRAEVPRHGASEALRARVRATLATAADAARTVPPRRQVLQGVSRAVPFGAGFAMAACLALFLLLGRAPGGGEDGLAEAVVSAHIRALQPGHLMDVVSTDQHTVKPWFDGRLAFAPPVTDAAPSEFPLAGGRLEYLAGRAAAALVYRRRGHIINVFVWPEGESRAPAASGSRDGYNFIGWHQDGVTVWAVSDLNAPELAGFVRIWRGW